MIKITAELVSALHSSRNRPLGNVTICNDVRKTILTNGVRGDYIVIVTKGGHKEIKWKETRVENFERLRKGVWDLLYLALENIVGERNRKKTVRKKIDRKKLPVILFGNSGSKKSRKAR